MLTLHPDVPRVVVKVGPVTYTVRTLAPGAVVMICSACAGIIPASDEAREQHDIWHGSVG